MPIESPRPLAQQLLRVVLGTSDVPDRDLLARFVTTRDEEAFAEIVRRHGPMVLAACRRVTGRPHDAEDAFQAAFLVLARRAGHLTRPELLANWLYGVACRTALDARASRRRAEEHVVSAAPEPAAPHPRDDSADLRRVIDEELAKLPDKYRTAVVLCDLEGLPRHTAAAQLGIPEGTLSSRLAHARKVLGDRLARRGVTASVTAISAVVGRDSLATVVPHTLTNTTVYAAARFVPGGIVPAGVSPAVSSLTDGVLKTMLATRLRQAFGIGLLACGLIGVGGALAQQLRVPVQDQDPLAALVPDDREADVAPPKTAPKKIAAKGVEDDDVPYATFPTQAVVRIEEGKLIVRQRVSSMAAVAERNDNGGYVTVFQHKSGVHAKSHDPADIAVFDMKGNRLAQKVWKETLKNDVHALITNDGKLPNPRELALFKQDTLLIVLPAPAGYYPMSGSGATTYAPAEGFPPPVVRPGTTFPPTPSRQPARPARPLTPSPDIEPTPAGAPSLTRPQPVPAGSPDLIPSSNTPPLSVPAGSPAPIGNPDRIPPSNVPPNTVPGQQDLPPSPNVPSTSPVGGEDLLPTPNSM
ncbi:sigma-70 family RNA polymerase sigma factor [Gemmata sp. G18]|uniref:Sigma-70 family RNA polymerase sigma factor n=1 Tax=Gemmata palustris TaxID=2822762 RepID=A0ABS5C2R2_9BACT|nr:sigma-70 family RNA polymerase sigma factor [Gemmata palustris]MBP3960272.1 sigma-70 family RNA polymerase sigma factor [Gemmata palustris]